MNKNNLRLNLASNLWLRFSPWLLWLMVLILPLIPGKMLLEKAIEMDKKLWLTSTRQMLMNEAQKYKTSLNPEFMLVRVLDKGALANLYSMEHRLELGVLPPDKIQEGIKAVEGLRKNPVSGLLPWGSSNVRKDIVKFLAFMKRKMGSDPDVVFCLGPESHSRFFWHTRAFDLPVSPAEFDLCLQRAYKHWIARSKVDVNAGKFFKAYHSVPELKEWLGFFYSPNCEVYGLHERFSGKVNDAVHHVTLRFKDAMNRDVILNLFYQHGKIDCREALKRIFAEENRGLVKHSFGYSSLGDLPQIIESEDSLEFIFELPAKFKNTFVKQTGYDREATPVLRLSVKVGDNYSAFINEANLAFLLRLMFLFSLLIPAGISLGRFNRHRSLKMILAFSFAIGALVPLLGLTWLTVSFVNSQKYFEAEEVFAEMKQQLEQIEKKMILQKARNEVYYSLLADRVERMDLFTRRQLPDLLKRFSNHQFVGRERVVRPIIGYYMLNQDGFEQLEMREDFLANLLQMKPFFSGYYNDLLLEMGSFAGLSREKHKEIQQKTQLAMGVTDQMVDREMFSEIVEFEGARVQSEMTPRREFLTGFLLDRKPNFTGSVFLVYSDNGNWSWQVHQMLRNKIIPVKFRVNDYRVVMTFFRKDRASQVDLYHLSVPGDLISIAERDFLVGLGRALFVNSGFHSIKNFSERPANLILARTMAEGNFFALAYAEKVSAQGGLKLTLIAIFVVFIALCSCLALAIGTARVLLMPLPAFLAAISKVQNQNYNWQLELTSGDEFEELGQSFNLMGRKLMEREKLSQLVSENVMEAITASDANLLQPGGEKRHAAILFSDIRGFTSLSEQYKAEEVVDMLNSYFSAMASIITENGGIIDKLIGDAIQAVFYQRAGLESAELRASRAAIAMKKSLAEYNQGRRQARLFEINNGIGIASGEVISGRVGSETGKLDATVLGPKLKLAETLEAKSKFALKQSILIDEQTASVLKQQADKLELMPFQPETSDEKTFELVRLIYTKAH